jgi:hypothetical protein
MKEYKARRSFYSDGQTGNPRQLIARGTTFQTSDYHAQQLIKNGIAARLSEADPSETQDIRPNETPEARPDEGKIIEPNEQQTISPGETKEDIPQETDGQAPQIDAGEPEKPLEGLEYSELKAMAREANIKGYHQMKKKDLIKHLSKGSG